MYPDRKVYDSDLVITPLIREIAHQYAREYVGNFDLMIQAHAYITETGQLEEGMYRPVLNTLRCDVLRPDLWGAVRSLLKTPERFTPEVSNVVPIRQKHTQPKERRQDKRVSIDMRTQIHESIIFMQAKPSGRAYRVLHRLHHDAYLRWQRPSTRHGWDMKAPLAPMYLRVDRLCGSSVHNPVLFTEAPEGMKECRKCYCVAHGIEYP